MKPWLKAGLIGGAVLVLTSLASLVPQLGVLCCCLSPLVYAVIGGMAALFLPAPRDAGSGAGQGALAGIVASLIGGLVNAILATIQASSLTAEQILASLPAEYAASVQQTPSGQRILEIMSGSTGGLVTGGLCCGAGILVAAVLGAIGGAIFAAIKKD